jgi:hypothetical protein
VVSEELALAEDSLGDPQLGQNRSPGWIIVPQTRQT